MSKRAKWTLCLVAGAQLLSPAVAVRSSEKDELPIRDVPLVQSELDFLLVRGHRISMGFKRATPAKVLMRIANAAGFKYEVDGTLPGKPRLTATFDDATVKEVLRWYAEKTGVTYWTKSPDTLVVIPEKIRGAGR